MYLSVIDDIPNDKIDVKFGSQITFFMIPYPFLYGDTFKHFINPGINWVELGPDLRQNTILYDYTKVRLIARFQGSTVTGGQMRLYDVTNSLQVVTLNLPVAAAWTTVVSPWQVVLYGVSPIEMRVDFKAGNLTDDLDFNSVSMQAAAYYP